MITRLLQSQITQELYKNQVIVLYGPRRSGKTTLVREILKTQQNSEYFNCEEEFVKNILSKNDSSRILNFFGDRDIIVLDEAQVIPEIGQRLKLLYDTKPELQIIATGSSSFDLANQVGSPLLGRMRQFTLYPFSTGEIINEYGSSFVYKNLEKLMIYGFYPQAFDKTNQEAKQSLIKISQGNLYKDILAYQELKKPALLSKLTLLLAINIGKELNYNWLAQRLNTSIVTIENYLDLLQKVFIIYKLNSLQKNLSKEISRGFKIYFTDLGLRNCLIENFNLLEMRTDVGGVWENFCVIEKLKQIQYQQTNSKLYFWRTTDQQEIDLVEVKNGLYNAFEFKYNERKTPKLPNQFAKAYPNHKFNVINPDNWLELLEDR
jgi:uncharacterized protein